MISEIEIRLAADIARLRQDMEAARRTVTSNLDRISVAAEGVKGVLSGIAAGLSVGAFVGFIKNSIDAADALNDMSARTKVAIEDLAGLAYAAKLGDTSLEGVASSITKLGQNIGKDGAKFRELGVTATEPLEAFKQLSDIFKNIQDPQQRAAFGAEALGKSWQEAAVLLEGGSDGISTLIARGKELSGVTEQVAADAGAFNDKLDELTFAAQGAGTRIAAGMLPTLQKIADALSADSVNGDKFAGTVTVLSAALKTMYSVGVGVLALFTGLGKSIGGTAAVAVAALTGDFKGALSIYKEMATDVYTGLGDAAIQIGKVWADTGKDVTKTADDTAKATGDSTAKVAAFLNSGEIAAARAKAAAAAEAAAKKEQAAYAGVIVSIQEKMAADKAEIAGGAAITPIQQLRVKLDAELATGKMKLTAEHRKEIDALLDNARALEKNAAAAKQVRAAVAALADERDKNYESLVAEAEANEKLVATFGKTKKQIEEMALARDQDRLAQRGALELSEDTVAQLEREIDARKRSLAAMGTLDVLEKQKKATDEAADAQKAFWKSIDDTAHSTFVNILEGNKNMWSRMKDTAKSAFFDWLYQQTIKKWIINVGTSSSSSGGIVDGIASAFGGGGAASSGGSGAGMLGTASNLFSIGKTIYSGFSAGIASSLGSTIGTLGTTFGSEAVAAFGAGMQGGALGATTASAASGYAGTAAAGAGASAASVVPIIGWIIAGMQAANGFRKQGFTPNNGTITNPIFQAVAAPTNMTNKLLEKLGVGGALANILSGASINTKLFGRADPRVESQGLRGSIDATGVNAETYAKIIEKGGWFRSSKRYEKTFAVAGATDTSFDDTTKSMISAVKGFGEAMGIETAAINSYTKSFDIKLTGKAEEDNAAVAKLFADVGDELSLRLVPGLSKFATQGEALSATLQRLATDYLNVDDILRAIGTTLKATGVAGIDLREGLITAAGGLDKLAAGVGYFQQNYLSEADRLAPVQKQLAEALAAIGYSALKTKDDFKAAVQGFDWNREGAAGLYVQLLALAPAFKEVTDATEAAAKAAADEAIAKAQAAAAATEQALKDNEALLRAGVGSALDGVKRAIDARKNELKASFDSVMEGFADSIAQWSAKITDLKSLSSLLSGARVGATQNSASRAAAQAQLESAFAIAKASGVLPSADSLRDAVAAVSQDSADQFSTLIEYQRDQQRAARSIAGLSGLTEDQLTTAEKTLLAIQSQKTAAEAAYSRQISTLDAMAATAERSASIALGTYQATMDANVSIGNLAAAVAALKFGATTSNPTGAGLTVDQLYQSVLGRPGDSEGLAFWKQAFGDVVDSTEYASFVQSASGELEAKANGTWVEWLAARGIRAPSTQSADPLVMAVDSLNEQMASMQMAMTRTANSTTQLAQQFDQVSGSGNALLTETP